MISQFLLALKVIIKQVFPLLVNRSFLILLSSPSGTCVIIQQMYRPSQTPCLTTSTAGINCRKVNNIGCKANMHVSHTPQNKWNEIKSSGISRLPKLPLILHPPGHFTESDQSQAQQGLLSPLDIPSPFPWLWFHQAVGRDSRNLVNPFMRVTNQMTRHLATLRESQLLPPLTRA